MGAEQEPNRGARTIEAAAEARLRESSELAAHPITCRFRDGNLTLRGRVSTYSLKLAAQSLVQQVPSVRCVDNQIDVIPVPASYGPSDDPRSNAGEDCCRTY
jgi:osmotically-inducible protein OsmY